VLLGTPATLSPPRLRGVRPRVLEGTHGYSRGSRAPCLALWYYGCCLRLRLATVRVHTQAPSFVQMCAHARTAHALPACGVHWRAAQRSRALRAGKYTWGDEGSNACPAGTTRIVAPAVCESAAVDSGKTWGGTEDNALFPVGCYWQTSSVYGFLNTNAVGAAYPNARLLCAVGSGAPSSRTPIRLHARRCACTGPMRDTPQCLSSVVRLSRYSWQCDCCAHCGSSIWLAATTTAAPTTATPTLVPSTTAPTPPPAAGMCIGWM
jgi:hypothetical protein